MSNVKLPRSVLEGRGTPFPSGVFIGTLTSAAQRWYKDKTTQQETTQFCDLVFADITPADAESPQVGNRKFQPSIPIIVTLKDAAGNLTNRQLGVVDVVEFNDDTPFQLRRAAGAFGQLAMAFGAAQPDDNGDLTFNMEAFIEDLLSGAYKGSTIGFEVRTATTKGKKDKDGNQRVFTNTDLVRAFALEAQEEVGGGNGQVQAAEVAPAPVGTTSSHVVLPTTARAGLRTRV